MADWKQVGVRNGKVSGKVRHDVPNLRDKESKVNYKVRYDN